MAWNSEKHRFECDRCGAKIDASQTVQLCRECAKKIKIEAKKIEQQETIKSTINEVIRQQQEYTEKTLAEIITKYDFIVGSIECKRRLLEVLPEGATVICSYYVESPTLIYAIKKFDITDLGCVK